MDAFTGTMAEMTWPRVEASARRGALVLLPLGVIEEHGPHLPLGVDVYGSCTAARLLRDELERAGVEALVAPPWYWGVNAVTSAFPGSFRVRPSIAEALLGDVVDSLVGDGFHRVLFVNHHADQAHLRVLATAAERQHDTGHAGVRWVEQRRVVDRLGQRGDEPWWILYEPAPEARALRRAGTLGIHASETETAMMLRWHPDLVDREQLARLDPTDLGPEDLERWREGGATARAITPLGYFGSPRPEDPELWRLYEHSARGMATATLSAFGLAE